MNILITGTGGFIGKKIEEYLCSTLNSTKNTIIGKNKESLDLLNRQKVKEVFSINEIDLVIHCAIVGGNRLDEDTPRIYEYNMKMFDNIIFEMPKTCKIINFGSGAEFFEKNNYGKSKRHMKLIGEHELKERYNHWRIYGCFGKGEESQRFITSALSSYYKKDPIHIHQNKLMDYVYIDDLLNFVSNNLYVNGTLYNMVYLQKYSLYDIAVYVNSLESWEVPIIIHNKDMAKSYCAYENIAKFKNEIGLFNGINIMKESL